jgi:hypothetical protein
MSAVGVLRNPCFLAASTPWRAGRRREGTIWCSTAAWESGFVGSEIHLFLAGPQCPLR